MVDYEIYGRRPNGDELYLFRWSQSRSPVTGLKQALKEAKIHQVELTDVWAVELPEGRDAIYLHDSHRWTSYEREDQLEKLHPGCINISEVRNSAGLLEAHRVVGTRKSLLAPKKVQVVWDTDSSVPDLAQTYMHCSRCLEELPRNTSPREWARQQGSVLGDGRIQIRCTRHDINIVTLSFRCA